MDHERFILQKLFIRRVIGGKHTALRNVVRSIPKHELGQARKVVRKLFAEDILLKKPTSYGLQVSINPEKLDEVRRRLR